MSTHIFTASGAIEAGWATFKTRPWYFMMVFFVVFFLSALLGRLDPWIAGDGPRIFVTMLFVLVLQIFIDMGLIAFVLKAVKAPEKVVLEDLIHPHPFFTYLAVTFITGLIEAIGFVALVIPGIYLFILFFFVKYTVIDRELEPIEAMRESVRIVHGHKFELFIFALVLIAINILGLLCLFVGLLVSVPVSFFAVAHAYRMLEGARSARVAHHV